MTLGPPPSRTELASPEAIAEAAEKDRIAEAAAIQAHVRNKLSFALGQEVSRLITVVKKDHNLFQVSTSVGSVFMRFEDDGDYGTVPRWFSTVPVDVTPTGTWRERRATRRLASEVARKNRISLLQARETLGIRG